MFAREVLVLAGDLADADPSTCDRDGLAELVQRSQRLRAWLDALDARIAFQATRLADEGACESPSSLLTGGGRRSTKDAEAAAGRGRVCALLPEVHDALAVGAVSSGHADALARVARDLDDAGRSQLKDLESKLVESAKESSVEAFEQQVRDLGRGLTDDEGVGRHERLRRQRSWRRWVDRQSGMCHTHLQLDPEADAKVSAALDAAIATERETADDSERTFDQLKADAMVQLITRARTHAGRVPEVSILIDYETLCHGLHEDGVCETADGQPLPPDSVRRLCCDAEIVPVVLDGCGVTLDVGRERRVASRAQRRALRAMYRGCAYPGCSVRFADCDIHHATPWHRFGRTDLANLLPLCNTHHHLVHEGGWRLTIHPDRTIVLTRPDSTIHFEGSTVNVGPRGIDTTEVEIVSMARARARALGPPSRAPAA